VRSILFGSVHLSTLVLVTSFAGPGCEKRVQESGTTALPVTVVREGTRPKALGLYDSTMAYLKGQQELAVLMEGIKDDASFSAALPNIERLVNQLHEMKEKYYRFFQQKATQAEREELSKKFPQGAWDATHERLVAARLRIQKQLPGRIDELDQILEKRRMGLVDVIKVAMAKRAVSIGTSVVDPEVLFEMREVRADKVPPLQSVYLECQALEGMVVVRSLKSDQIVTRQDVVGLPQGMQVKIVKSSLGGSASVASLPGSRIDLLKAMKAVARDVLVLGAEAKEGNGKQGLVALVLATTADQSAQIAAGEETGGEWTMLVRKADK
jgi:hypothetical protein